jgi:opacity protein-like surface antigen
MKMRKNLKAGCSNLSAVTFLLTVCIALPVYGADANNPSRDWEIRLMPYVWIPSMKADSTVNGLSGSVDLSTHDVIDSLNMAAMGRVEAWRGKWGLTFDGTYMFLGANDGFQGRRDAVRFNFDADVRVGMVDFGLAYRIYEQQFGNNNEQCFALEPYAGLRYGYLRQKIDVDVDLGEVGSAGQTLGTSEDWVEPFVGGRIVLKLNDRWSLNTRADAGGFGIGSASDLTWQVAGGVDYKITKNIIFNAGYRYVDFDYSRGSGSNEFGVHLKAKGPVLGLTILW